MAGGGTALDPLVVSSLVGGRRRSLLDELTPRERDVLGLLAEGRSNRAIAGRLFLSARAVERHVQAIFEKLWVPNTEHDNRRVLAVLALLGRWTGSASAWRGTPRILTSFDLLAPRGEELVETFYERLFETAPSVRPLFGGDPRRQRAMLLQALVLVRRGLRDLGALVPVLRKLGARHVAYGVRPEHYPVVADTLIAAMAELAGDAWTARYALAWERALAVVAGAMRDGAAEVEYLLAA